MKKLLVVFFSLILSLSSISALACGDTITTYTTMTADLSCSGSGITFGANDITLDCAGHSITGINTGAGVSINSISGASIKNCNIQNFYEGISANGAQDTLIQDNIILNFELNAIVFFGGNNNIIRNNIIENADQGIYLRSSSNNNLVQNNELRFHEGTGVLIDLYSNGNTIENNIMNDNIAGINLASSDSNTVRGNTLKDNSYAGIYVRSSSNNAIYNNYFENIVNLVYVSGTNSWNIAKTPGTNIIGGPYFGGNYWSDYAGEDLDSDGLGDTLLPHNQDNLPLVIVINRDRDGDGIPDEEDKCEGTIEEQLVYGCSCTQILSLKPGEDTSENRQGCSQGLVDVFTKAIGWAKDLF